MSSLIFIVEDEPDLVTTLEYNFEREGYATKTAATGRAALELIYTGIKPDLILLDLMLPDISGLDICRKLRSSEDYKSIPVIMLTAKGEEIDRVVGFEVGADDYVTKPFSIRELLLRMRAVLRRSQHQHESRSEEELLFGRLRVSIPAHQVWVDELEVQLTALEFKLLQTMLSRKGRVQTRDVLLTDVWEITSNVTTRTVDTHVKRLREKLGTAGVYIETLRGVGYRWRSQV